MKERPKTMFSGVLSCAKPTYRHTNQYKYYICKLQLKWLYKNR